MPKLSIIIPAWKEPYLYKTVNDIFQKATGDIEVIASLDGTIPEIMPIKDHRLTIISNKTPGMRASINACLSIAKGEYVMKTDAHCMFSEGFDETLIKNCEENWLMVPRRYSLFEEDWRRRDDKPIIDYHYFSYPDLISSAWKHDGPEIDDTMSIQGSCYFANRNYFMKHVGFLDDNENTYGNFTGEQHEVGLKYWLGNGEIKVLKTVWYAHLVKRSSHYHRGIFDRSSKR